MNKIVGIVFSKDRPLQLDLALKSFYLYCVNNNLCDVKVIYTTSNDRFEFSYSVLRQQYNNVEFFREYDFKNNLLDSIDGYEKVLFFTDDNIWVKSFDIEEVSSLLDKDQYSLGFSFRLGKNTTYCYSLNSNQLLPDFQNVNQNIFRYNWTESVYDFSYPLELSSSIYRTKDLKDYLKNLRYENPNDLEWVLYLKLYSFFNKPMLMCYGQSVAFCAPMNKVQKVNNNRVGSMPGYDVDMLLNKFEQGYRIPLHKTFNYIPGSAHEEFDWLEDEE